MGREQRVKIDSHTSSWKRPLRGVPQGSLAGPVFFNMFINDLLYLDLHSLIFNYADDNTLLCTGVDTNTIKTMLTNDCHKLIEWFSKNQMKANPEKFQFMILGKNSDSTQHSLNVAGSELKGSISINILGVELDQRLNFDKHIDALCNKVATQINAISRIKNNLCIKGKQILYNSFIVGNFNYCNTIWMFTSRRNLSRLDKLNKRAIKLIYNKHGDYDVLMKDNNHLDIYKMCVKSLGVNLYKIRNQISPPYLQDLLKVKDNCYNMRDPSTYVLPKFNTKYYGYHSLRYVGSKMWNWLDVDIKLSSDVDNFKREIKSLLMKCDKNLLLTNFF